MATPLLDLAKADEIATLGAQQRATDELQRVQAQAAAVPVELMALDGGVVDASACERALWAQFEAATTQAERDDLVMRIRDVEIELRGLRARQAAAREDGDRLSRQASALEREAQRTKAEAVDAAAERTAQEKAVDQTQPKPGEPPRPPNRADVGKLLDASQLAGAIDGQTALRDAAQARAYLGIPAAFAQRIQGRAARRREAAAADAAIVSAVATAQSGLRVASDGLAAKTEAARAAFTAAEAAARDYALRGQERLGAIVASLTAIAASPELPKADVDRLKGGMATANDAFTHEQALDDARTTRDAKDALLEEAWRNAVTAAPDQDPAADAAVVAARQALDAADAEVKAKEAAYTAAERVRVDRLEATIPDTRWQVIGQYEEAAQALAALRALDAAGLRKALDDAEQALADAILEQRNAELRAPILAARRAYRSAAIEAATPVAAAADFSAIRGDG
jgi:hypothetical protein